MRQNQRIIRFDGGYENDPNERDCGQFVPSRRRRTMANFRAECDPGLGAGSKFSGRRPDEFGLIKVLSTQAHSGL
jgi:hypothetical protein